MAFFPSAMLNSGVIGLAGALLLTGCNSGSSGTADTISVAQVVTTDANIASAAYNDSLSTAQTLKTALQSLVDTPSPASLSAARLAWLAAREPYGQTEVYRFRLSPIDSTDGLTENGPEARINAWPLGEAMIDYVAVNIDGDAGPEAIAPGLTPNLVADTAAMPVINKTTLASFNQAGGDERNVATGAGTESDEPLSAFSDGTGGQSVEQVGDRGAVDPDGTIAAENPNGLHTGDADGDRSNPDGGNAFTQPQLLFPRAEIGPLDATGRYLLAVDVAPQGADYRIVVDGKRVTGYEDTIPIFFPEPGRHQLQLQVAVDDQVHLTDPIEIYVAEGPRPGFRANLSSIQSRPENWPEALRQFDQLVLDGHTELKLSLSTRPGSGQFPYWNYYVDGFGADRDGAMAYCEEFDLSEENCFVAEV